MLSPWLSLSLAVQGLTHSARQKAIYNQASNATHAASAITALQTWYNEDTGLWDTTGWWNGANALTMLANFAAIDLSLNATAYHVYQHTFEKAQQANIDIVKVMSAHSLSSRTDLVEALMVSFPGFLNDYYDDEGWYVPISHIHILGTNQIIRWALAWLKIYDNTKQDQYLQAAQAIFEDMTTGWNAPCGGMWWDKAHTYSGAIENELFLTVAAQLANRVSTARENEHYLNWALTQWDWFHQSGMINSNHTINNGLDLATCQNDNGTIWSYNQGVILGALVELHWAFPDPEYLFTAERIAHAAIEHLSDCDGILHEPCEPHCGNDGPQFKGIFMRNLQLFQAARPSAAFGKFIRRNADSIWLKDRGSGDQLGLVWSGPFTGADASTQSSACDALVAALAIGGTE